MNVILNVLADRWKDVLERASRADEMLDTARRVQADFIRYQERAKKEKEAEARFGIEKLILELLPSLDAFDQCLDTVDDPEITQGVELVRTEILRALGKFGVELIGEEGEAFDPARHQAVEAVEDDKQEPNTVLKVFKKGYRLHERIVRPALVRVSRRGA